MGNDVVSGGHPAYANDQLPAILASKQHPEPDRRLLQTLQHVQALLEAAVAQSRSEPPPRLVVARVVVEDEKPLHASVYGAELVEIAHGIRLRSRRLRDPAAQHDARIRPQVRQRRIQRWPADIVEIEVDAVRTRPDRKSVV